MTEQQARGGGGCRLYATQTNAQSLVSDAETDRTQQPRQHSQHAHASISVTHSDTSASRVENPRPLMFAACGRAQALNTYNTLDFLPFMVGKQRAGWARESFARILQQVSAAGCSSSLLLVSAARLSATAFRHSRFQHRIPDPTDPRPIP